MSDMMDDHYSGDGAWRKNPGAGEPGPTRKGRGYPPAEYRFKKGGKGGPGRPKGSRNRLDFDKLLEEKVTVGEDRLGRPIRKPLGEVINRQLLRKAGGGDLSAIRLVNDFKLRLQEIELRHGPKALSRDEIVNQLKEEEERKRLTAELTKKFTNMLEVSSVLKHHDLIEDIDGVTRFTAKFHRLVSQDNEGSGSPY